MTWHCASGDIHRHSIAVYVWPSSHVVWCRIQGMKQGSTSLAAGQNRQWGEGQLQRKVHCSSALPTALNALRERPLLQKVTPTLVADSSHNTLRSPWLWRPLHVLYLRRGRRSEATGCPVGGVKCPPAETPVHQATNYYRSQNMSGALYQRRMYCFHKAVRIVSPATCAEELSRCHIGGGGLATRARAFPVVGSITHLAPRLLYQDTPGSRNTHLWLLFYNSISTTNRVKYMTRRPNKRFDFRNEIRTRDLHKEWSAT